MDEGLFPCANYGDESIQNSFYEDYACRVKFINMFVIDSTGAIVLAALNFSKSWHYTRLFNIIEMIYPLLGDDRTPSGYDILCDSAFPVDDSVTSRKLVRARKSTE